MASVVKFFCVPVLAFCVGAGSGVYAGTLDDVKAKGAIRIAYREDAPPFSFRKDNTGNPMGFMVDLCRSVVTRLGQQLGKADLRVEYVPVTSVNRFETIASGKADLLCEATTHTLKRRETVGFSIPTFVDGASFVIGPNGPKNVKSLEGKKVGVLAGTTTEAGLKQAIERTKVKAEIVLVKSHGEGIEAVERKTIAAYYGDRGILTFLIIDRGSPAGLLLADTYLSMEPYALALRRGDEDFRLAVDRALSHIYRSGEVTKLFTKSFGSKVTPSPVLKGLYQTSGLPD